MNKNYSDFTTLSLWEELIMKRIKYTLSLCLLVIIPFLSALSVHAETMQKDYEEFRDFIYKVDEPYNSYDSYEGEAWDYLPNRDFMVAQNTCRVLLETMRVEIGRDGYSNVTKESIKEAKDNLVNAESTVIICVSDIELLYSICKNEINERHYYDSVQWGEFQNNLNTVETYLNTPKAESIESTSAFWELYGSYNQLCVSNHVPGDADGDGSVTILDATKIQRVLADLDSKPNSSQKFVMDVRNDGVVDSPNITDATEIQRYLAGLTENEDWCSYLSYLSNNVDNKQTTANRIIYQRIYNQKWHIADGNKPEIVVRFEDINNVFSHNRVTVSAFGGKAPYQYKYTIRGAFHAYSDYGTDFGEYGYDYSEEPTPGAFMITTGYIGNSMTTIPTNSLTYGDYYSLVVSVKDANGVKADSQRIDYILNSDNGETLRVE